MIVIYREEAQNSCSKCSRMNVWQTLSVSVECVAAREWETIETGISRTGSKNRVAKTTSIPEEEVQYPYDAVTRTSALQKPPILSLIRDY